MDQLSDTELIRNCQRGEKSSFRALVDRYKDRVYTIAFRIVGNVHDAEDIAQEAFIAAYRSIGSFDLGRKFLPWLMRITTNLSIDHVRRRQPRTVPLDTILGGGRPLEPRGNAGAEGWSSPAEDAASLLKYSDADPLEAVEASELYQLIEQLISQLSPKYRLVITLYYTEDLTYSEIADALNIPMGTVKTYLHRGRETLKARLKGVLLESVGT